MPSDKGNSIMTIHCSYMLDFFTVKCHFIPETCLFANHSCSNAFIVGLLKFTFILFCVQFLTLLPHR